MSADMASAGSRQLAPVRGGPTGRVRVVPMRRRHLAQVLGIERCAYPSPWSPATFETELSQPNRCYLVARRGRAVMGFAGAQVAAGEAHVLTVAVDPARRCRGIGALLVRALLDEAVRRGASAATLEVRERNLTAQRLYARFGFVPKGSRPGYYTDSGESAIVMWLHDLATSGT